MTKLPKFLISPVVFGLVLLPYSNSLDAKSKDAPKSVIVKMNSKSDSKAGGMIRIRKVEKGLVIEGRLRHLEPGEHGFHIHETGDCSASDASSAGGHFAFKDQKHGELQGLKSHAGDLGNITADDKGTAEFQITKEDLCMIKGQDCSILGRALVVHAKRDDLKSQPSGDSGSRIACGVIE